MAWYSAMVSRISPREFITEGPLLDDRIADGAALQDHHLGVDRTVVDRRQLVGAELRDGGENRLSVDRDPTGERIEPAVQSGAAGREGPARLRLHPDGPDRDLARSTRGPRAGWWIGARRSASAPATMVISVDRPSSSRWLYWGIF